MEHVFTFVREKRGGGGGGVNTFTRWFSAFSRRSRTEVPGDDRRTKKLVIISVEPSGDRIIAHIGISVENRTTVFLDTITLHKQ